MATEAIIDDANNGGSDDGAYEHLLCHFPWKTTDGVTFRHIGFRPLALQCAFDAGENASNTGSPTFRHPTLTSGCEARPPEGTSGGGKPGRIIALRMAGNGETSFHENPTAKKGDQHHD